MTPLADGKPSLKGGEIVRAFQGEQIVAIVVGEAVEPGLYFLNVRGATIAGMCPMKMRGGGCVAFSRDGRRFARRREDGLVEVRDIPGNQPPVLVARRETPRIHFATLGRSCLLVREFDLDGPRRARRACLLRWDQGTARPAVSIRRPAPRWNASAARSSFLAACPLQNHSPGH